MEMEQPYWTGIHDSLADDIQFVENHTRLMDSTNGSLQRPTKKKARFSCVLDMQIRIPIPQPHPFTFPPRRSPLPPLVADSTLVFDSPSRSPSPPRPPPPSTIVVDDLQFESAEFRMSSPSHHTPAVLGSPPPSLQVVLPIQVI